MQKILLTCSYMILYHKQYLNKESNEWVTFIHGAGGSSSIWFSQLKDFKKTVNVLLIDLRGHGGNKESSIEIKYTFDIVVNDILEVLDYRKINESHFIGISLGTIIIRKLADAKPALVKSMILGGAILKLNIKSKILISLGQVFYRFVPYMVLYRLFALIILPRKNHKASRILFIREARKLYQNEFDKWFGLIGEINSILKEIRNIAPKVPTLYIMGEQDYIFLPIVDKLVNFQSNSSLQIISNCGHVVNVEKPDLFNQLSLSFLLKS